jgi:hypothetical protein
MAPTYDIYERRRVIVITWLGDRPKLHEWRTIFDVIVASPILAGHEVGVVSDWRRMSNPPPEEFVRDTVEYAAEDVEPQRIRWASVVPDTPAFLPFRRQAEMLAGSKRLIYQTFTDLREAVAWAVDALHWL